MKSTFPKTTVLKVLLVCLCNVSTKEVFSQRLSDVRDLKSSSLAIRTQQNSNRLIYVRGTTQIRAEEGTDSDMMDEFLKFYIPSAILFSGIEPAGISKVNLAFGEDKIEFKIGTMLNKQPDDDDDDGLSSSIGIELSAKAPDGARTLFKYDKTPRDFEATFIYTYITNHEAAYIWKDPAQTEKIYISRKASWLNVSGTLGNSKRVLFTEDTVYTEKNYTNFTLLVSHNWFFNGWLDKLPKKRKTLSLSIGCGNFDNYDALDDYTLRRGIVDASGKYMGETESVAGKKGAIERTFGLLVSGSAFKPVTKFDSKTSVTLGINANSFGLGTPDHYVNINAGVYIAKRSYDTEEEELKEDFSFGVLADFSDLTSVGEKDYYNDNFTVIVTAQIPLRFWE